MAVTADQVRDAIAACAGDKAAAARKLGISRTRVYQIIQEKQLDVAGKPRKSSAQVEAARIAKVRTSRKRAAENRAAGLCSCGRQRRECGKTCQVCFDHCMKQHDRVSTYAKENGCTIAEARIAIRERAWKERVPK